MNVWLVSPAWRRTSITRLVLAQRRWLCDTLAARGITANSVIVTDDDNAQAAAEYGFPAVRVDNRGLGRRFNAGYRYAADQGATHVVHVGSDDWVHPDVLTSIPNLAGTDVPTLDAGRQFVVWRPGPKVLVHRELAVVDMGRGTLMECETKSRYGVIPWLIPRELLEPRAFTPVTPWLRRGIDGDLMRGLGTPPLAWADHGPLACVDFKTSLNITGYQTVRQLATRERDAWEALTERYPVELVEHAERVAAGEKPRPARRLHRRSVWFVTPAHGRTDHARVCLEQLAHTCQTLTENGVDASAVVIADDDNLDTAEELGFATVLRENTPLGRKWNDGYQLACDPDVNPRPADYAIPFGSDDWLDPALILEKGLPGPGEVACYRQAGFVDETGTQLTLAEVAVGVGIKIIPAQLLKTVGYRPAEDDRVRAIDASVNRGLGHIGGVFRDLHPLQIVDFKSADVQLNSYDVVRGRHAPAGDPVDPWPALASVYPARSVAAMRHLYEARRTG